MTGPSWLELDRSTFDVDAPAELFTLEPASVPAPDDGCGTGDLLELI